MKDAVELGFPGSGVWSWENAYVMSPDDADALETADPTAYCLDCKVLFRTRVCPLCEVTKWEDGSGRPGMCPESDPNAIAIADALLSISLGEWGMSTGIGCRCLIEGETLDENGLCGDAHCVIGCWMESGVGWICAGCGDPQSDGTGIEDSPYCEKCRTSPPLPKTEAPQE